MQRIFSLILVLLLPSTGFAQTGEARLKAWQEDLTALTTGLQEKHKNPFTLVSREVFQQKTAELQQRLPQLQDHEILVEFMKLTALIGDGHTNLSATRQARPWGRYPFAPLWMKDGLFIIAAPEQHKELLRARIVGVGKLPINEVEERLGTLAGHDNEYSRKESVRRWIVVPEVLAGLGIIEDMGKMEITVLDRNEQRRTVTLAPLSPLIRGSFLIDPDPKQEKFPVWRQLQREVYGQEWLAEQKTLYCWYDTCSNQPNHPVSAWCAEVLQTLDEKRAERIVLDVRRNGGGNSALIAPLMNGLAQRETFRRPGSIIVLISRHTFSSAMMNALHFRQRLKAVLIGSPTGGSPNHFGEVRSFLLPHCQWNVQYSTKLFKLTNDGAKTVKPDLDVEWTAKEFFAGRDPVLEAALNYKSP